MEALAAEAMQFDKDGKEVSMDEAVQRALECPCVADLKTGPCGTPFIDAFSCFLRSTEEEKGSDCVKAFVTLQNCIKENPDAFSKDVLEEEEEEESDKKEEGINTDYTIRAPSWAKESVSPKSKI